MNKRDKLLIRELERNAKLSSRRLAMRVGLPISTTHRRVKNLEKQGIIKGYRAIIDYEKTDRPIPMLAFINVAETTRKEKHVPISLIKHQLTKLPECYELLDVKGGNWDLIVKARLSSLKETTSFLEKLRKIKGIEEVSSTIITEEIIV